ncbi:MAG: type VI secretion system-associated protein TagF, partial [Gammaproteobacteria bacterium]|nr:type VI secretion system-associated protein TagF [Gammaproteobacteria bacterium]
REWLGKHWLDLYLSSPIWRFALAAGVCGPEARTGVLMPSMDKVGRYFPLTISVGLPSGSGPFQIAQGAKEWHRQAEEVALSALAGNTALEDFDMAVKGLGTVNPVKDFMDCHRQGRTRTQWYRWRVPLRAEDLLANHIPAAIRDKAVGEFRSCSLWWTGGSETISPSLLICEGLPPAKGYVAMLAGNWREVGWGGWPGARLVAETAEDDAEGLEAG